MIDILQEEYQITEFYYDPYHDDSSVYDSLQGRHFDVVVCWQILPPRHILNEKISFKKGVFFPMYDGGPRNDSPQWNEYRDFLIINFSKTMHQDCLSIGLSSRYIQYFPKPVDVQNWGDRNSVFFWNRIEPINMNTVADLLSQSGVRHLHLHKALDPSQKFKKLSRNWNVEIAESTWYDDKNDMLADIDKSALYIAPRLYEGIGMSFLEAMARGRCVIAPDLPTMNEYIENGVTGLLYDPEAPAAISLDKVEIIQKNAAEYIRNGYLKWEKKKKEILSWIEAEREYKPVLLFDATVLMNGLCNGAGRTGIYFVAYNIFRKLLKSEKFSVAAYCGSDHVSRLKTAFDRFFPEHTITILSEKSDFSSVNAFFSPIFRTPACLTDTPWIAKSTVLYDLITIFYPEWFKNNEQKWVQELLDSLNDKDSYFAISHCTKKDFLDYAKGLAEEQVTVIPLAANEKFYPCTDSAILESTRKKYGMPAKPYILSLSSLEPRKNLKTAVKAFISFKKDHPEDDLVFVLCGAKWKGFDSELAQEIPELKNFNSDIIMTGYVDDEDLAALYSGAEFFVYDSLYEGFGLPPLEAMQCGTPVIASNATSVPEVVGNAGILVDPSSVEELEKAIALLRANAELRQEMKAKGIERAALFSWDKCVDIVEETLLKKISGELPAVSVVTCLGQNGNLCEEELEKCLTSVHFQQYRGKIEHVVHGPEKKEELSGLLADYVAKGWVRYVQEKEGSLATAASLAEGEYIVFLSPKDRLSNCQAIALCARSAMLEKADCVYTDVVMHFPDGQEPRYGDGTDFLPFGWHQNHRALFVKRSHAQDFTTLSELLVRMFAGNAHTVYVNIDLVNTDVSCDHGLSFLCADFYTWIGRRNGLSREECVALANGSFRTLPREHIHKICSKLPLARWSSAVLSEYYRSASNESSTESFSTSFPELQEKRLGSFFARLAKYRLLSHIGSRKSKRRYKEKLTIARKKVIPARKTKVYVLGIPLMERVRFSNMESWNLFGGYPLFTSTYTSGRRTYSVLGIRLFKFKK